MKIKFSSDDDLPLNKPLKFHAMTIIIRSVFEEDDKFYLQLFLDDALYELHIKKKMLEYDRIDILEGMDVNKTSASKECDICHFWYFKYIGFKYEPRGCHDLMQKAMIFNDVAIFMLKKVLTKFTFGIMNNFNLVDKKGVL